MILTLKGIQLSHKIMLLIIIKMEENRIPKWNDYLGIGHSLLDTISLRIGACLICLSVFKLNEMLDI